MRATLRGVRATLQVETAHEASKQCWDLECATIPSFAPPRHTATRGLKRMPRARLASELPELRTVEDNFAVENSAVPITLAPEVRLT
jgi:hypothetical protein